MAIGTPTLAAAQTGATGTTATTASFTPAAGALLIAMCSTRGGSAVMPSVSDSLDETWTPFSAGLTQGSGSALTRARLFWKVATAAAQTVTCTSTGASQVGLSVTSITGAGTDFTNFQEVTNAAGDPSLTLAAFTAGSAGFFAGVFNAGSGATQSNAYTELFDSQLATNHRQCVGYDLTSPSATIGMTSASTETILFGVEIKEPVAAGGTALKVFDGSSFVVKPMKVWDGGAWVTKPVKRWTGSAWV